MWFLDFTILRLSEVLGFGRIFWRFWMIFSSVLRFLTLYTPMPPSVINEEHSMMSSDWLRVALLLHALWHGKKKKLASRTFIHDRHVFKAQAIRSFHKR